MSENTLTLIEKNEIVESKSLMQDTDLGSFYSISPKTKKDKVSLFNALTNPDERLGDHINKTISVKDVLIEIVELTQESTGELVKCPRIILIDKDGKSYQCVSVGIFSAIRRITKLFGEPTWEEPVNVIVKQITKKDRKMLSLELAK